MALLCRQGPDPLGTRPLHLISQAFLSCWYYPWKQRDLLPLSLSVSLPSAPRGLTCFLFSGILHPLHLLSSLIGITCTYFGGGSKAVNHAEKKKQTKREKDRTGHAMSPSPGQVSGETERAERGDPALLCSRPPPLGFRFSIWICCLWNPGPTPLALHYCDPWLGRPYRWSTALRERERARETERDQCPSLTVLSSHSVLSWFIHCPIICLFPAVHLPYIVYYYVKRQCTASADASADAC